MIIPQIKTINQRMYRGNYQSRDQFYGVCGYVVRLSSFCTKQLPAAEILLYPAGSDANKSVVFSQSMFMPVLSVCRNLNITAGN